MGEAGDPYVSWPLVAKSLDFDGLIVSPELDADTPPLALLLLLLEVVLLMLGVPLILLWLIETAS